MKQLIIIVLVVLGIAFAGQAQTKSDTTKTQADTVIAVQMPLNQFRALLYSLDQNIDSKKTSKEILEFLQKSARIVQPVDKPKGQVDQEKNKPKN
jgi:hypothetical protein